MRNTKENIIRKVRLLDRRFTFRILGFFWLIFSVYVITHAILKYFIIVSVWGENNLANYAYNFLRYNVLIGLLLGAIHSIAIWVLTAKSEKMIFEVSQRRDNTAAGATDSLMNSLYQGQKYLPYLFVTFTFMYSLLGATDWVASSIYADLRHWLFRINAFLLYFFLGFYAFRFFKLTVVRHIGNVANRFEISLMGNKKPLNMIYENLISGIGMGLFCICLAVYLDNLTSYWGDLTMDRFIQAADILRVQEIPMDNLLITDIVKHEVGQAAILLVGVDPYMGLDEERALAIFRGSIGKDRGYYMLIAYLLLLFLLYFRRSIFLIQRLVEFLSSYLRGVLQGVTSLRKSVPLLRFDNLGYMTGYLNLLFRHIHKIIINLVNSVVELGEFSEKSMADAARGTDEIYSITHGVSSINLKADLQLQSIHIIHEAFNDLRNIITSINTEVSMQKKQLENAKNMVEGVKTAITEMEDSSQSVAKLFEKLNNSAGSGLNIVGNAYSVMSDIAQTSYSIRDIVSSIEKISGQTGLLAMSASIESAHAGNHGVGFSVVAQSVRNLSDDSGVQSKAIRAQIEEMVQKVEVGVQLSRHVNRSFQSIASSTQISADLFHQIYNSIEEQNQQSITISSEIDQLLATTEEILSFTQEQVEILDQLTQVSVDLEKAIKSISEASQRQSNMSAEVIALFENLNSQVVLNIERVHVINEKVNRFELD